MPRFAGFAGANTGEAVRINPAQVLFVSAPFAGSARIHFGKENWIDVSGALDEVEEKLTAALNTDSRKQQWSGANKDYDLVELVNKADWSDS